MSIIGVVKIIQKKRFIKYENAAESKQRYMKKHERKFDIVFKILFLIVMAMLFINISLPGLKDIPYVLSDKYEIIDGFVDNKPGSGSRIIPRRVTIKSSNGEIVKIKYFPTYKVKKDDYIKMIYTPHLKIGTLLEHKRLKQ